MKQLPGAAERLLEELVEQLGLLETGGPGAQQLVARALPALLDSDRACVYDFLRDERGLQLDVCETSGFDPRAVRQFVDAGLAQQPQGYFAYDPARPSARQRNVALTLEEITRLNGGDDGRIVQRTYPRLGIAGAAQLRVLVCEGPSLLTWMGVFRDEPFDDRERRLLQRLVGPVQRRLLLERQLGASDLHRAALQASLESLGLEAFVVRFRGAAVHVEEANGLGRAALAIDAEEVRRALRQSLAAQPGEPAPYALTELSARGLPGYRLALKRAGAPGDLATRLLLARRHWQLTPRQCEVLGLLARGRANKTIATELGCAEVTVEAHVTQLLEKSASQNRAELVARFWTMQD